jgi:hypothetical protein
VDALKRLDSISVEKFGRQSLPEKILQINELFGTRLWSQQLANAWLRILRRCGDGEVRAILLRDVLELAPWMDANLHLADQLFESRRIKSDVSQVHMIISCEKYLERATRLFESVRDRLSPTLIVIGNPALQVAQLCDHVLVVPSPDSYEHLTRKVNEALLAIRSNFGAVSVLKMDDDLVSTGNVVPPQLSGMDYAGHLIGDERLDRAWHFGKTANRQVRPYAKRFRVCWARGTLYWLSARSVDVLARELLMYPGQLEGEIYEDKYVADILASAGIALVDYDLAGTYALKEDVPPDPTSAELSLADFGS